MPTKHPRIPGTRDAELDEALARVDAIFGPPERGACMTLPSAGRRR
jgi:hypothetical protein